MYSLVNITSYSMPHSSITVLLYIIHVSLHMGKTTELIYKIWDSQTFSRNSADLDKTTSLLFYIC